MGRFRNRDEAIAALKRIPAEMTAELQVQGDTEAAGLAAAIKAAAPVGTDLEHQPGALREATSWDRDTKRPLKWHVRNTARDAKGRFIAKSVEFGHLAADGSHVPPVPFAYPTKRSRARGIKNRMAAAGRRGAKKAAPLYVK